MREDTGQQKRAEFPTMFCLAPFIMEPDPVVVVEAPPVPEACSPDAASECVALSDDDLATCERVRGAVLVPRWSEAGMCAACAPHDRAFLLQLSL